MGIYKKQKKQVLVRMTPYNYEKLKEVSEKNRRSISSQVEHLVEQYIESYESPNGKISKEIKVALNLL